MSRQPFAVLWDMDGTLVDTAEHHFHAWVRICREHGRDFTRQDFQDTFGKRNPEIIEYLFDDKVNRSIATALPKHLRADRIDLLQKGKIV